MNISIFGLGYGGCVGIGCPIVSVDVGDVREILSDIGGCYVSDNTVASIASCVNNTIHSEDVPDFTIVAGVPQKRLIPFVSMRHCHNLS